jgi:hypothetical protein
LEVEWEVMLGLVLEDEKVLALEQAMGQESEHLLEQDLEVEWEVMLGLVLELKLEQDLGWALAMALALDLELVLVMV